MAYTEQYRTGEFEYVMEGHTQEDAASVFKVCTASIKKWRSSYEASGSTVGGYTACRRGYRKIDPEKLRTYWNTAVPRTVTYLKRGLRTCCSRRCPRCGPSV